MKKTYRYGLFSPGTTKDWDCIDIEKDKSIDTVKTYSLSSKRVYTRQRIPEESYSLIITSEISYDTFINSPEIALELIKNEHENKEK